MSPRPPSAGEPQPAAFTAVDAPSRATAYRRIAAGEVPARTEHDGSLSIARGDVRLLKLREASKGDMAGRRAVPLRPSVAQHEAWEREAKRRGLKVSQLASQLMDAAGYASPED